jgi:hypothetical protein
MLLQVSSLSWLATLVQIGGWVAGIITIAITVHNWAVKRREAAAVKTTKEAGLQLLGWTLQDRLNLESRLARIENEQEAQKETYDLIGKLMANVLRTS